MINMDISDDSGILEYLSLDVCDDSGILGLKRNSLLFKRNTFADDNHS